MDGCAKLPCFVCVLVFFAPVFVCVCVSVCVDLWTRSAYEGEQLWVDRLGAREWPRVGFPGLLRFC